MTTSYARHYAGQKVLITGGLGFLGSNLALRLLELGAQVTIADAAVETCGANLANLAPHTSACRIRLQDIGDAQDLRDSIAESDVVFDLAGDISHGHSMQWPERDLWRNTSAHLRLLQECSQTRPGIRFVFASTRQVYGQPRTLPVDEGHPIHPSDFNGVHKHATEQYCQLLTAQGGVDAVVLRLTNLYGPRLALHLPWQGFLGVFFRRALTGKDIELYDDGSQLRDPVYVDDAVDAFLRAGAARHLPSRIYNVGGAEALSLREIAASLLAAAGSRARLNCVPFPAERKRIDIGDFYACSQRISDELGWTPVTAFRDGVEKTLQFFHERLDEYLDPPLVSLHQSLACRSAKG